MQVTAEHAERWAAKFEKLTRTQLFELLESSFVARAPSWTQRARTAQEILQLVALPHTSPRLFEGGRVRALTVALRLGEWVGDWVSQTHPAHVPPELRQSGPAKQAG